MGINPEVSSFELVLENLGRGLAFEAGDDDAADIDPPIGQVIDQLEGIHIIGDSEIRPDFFAFDIAGKNAKKDIGLVLELLQETHLHIWVEAGQNPGRVIIEQDFPAKF